MFPGHVSATQKLGVEVVSCRTTTIPDTLYHQPVESFVQGPVVGAQETGKDPKHLAQVAATAVVQVLLQQQQQQQQRRRKATAAWKIELKDFRTRQEDWEDLIIEHLAKAEALGFTEEPTKHKGRDTTVGAEGFDASGVDPLKLR